MTLEVIHEEHQTTIRTTASDVGEKKPNGAGPVRGRLVYFDALDVEHVIEFGRGDTLVINREIILTKHEGANAYAIECGKSDRNRHFFIGGSQVS